ncbi:hypothetical protein BH11PSE11_BH11PSE11_34720 [soil metagenome]
MKRYRILSFDFDSRVHAFTDETDPEKIRQAGERLKFHVGEANLDLKIKNFMDLGPKPMSVAAFHNRFLEQIRDSYAIGSYYPALTGACALGERILNHLMLKLRDEHRSSPEYKNIYRKDSFDFWPMMIDCLEAWTDLLPDAVDKFRTLNAKRNMAIHFNIEVDQNDRSLALEAIHLIQDIVRIQFSSFGTQPWYFCIPGEMYIRRKWETKPFVKHILIPNALHVSPTHAVKIGAHGFEIDGPDGCSGDEITDEEFIALRHAGKK